MKFLGQESSNSSDLIPQFGLHLEGKVKEIGDMDPRNHKRVSRTDRIGVAKHQCCVILKRYRFWRKRTEWAGRVHGMQINVCIPRTQAIQSSRLCGAIHNVAIAFMTVSALK